MRHVRVLFLLLSPLACRGSKPAALGVPPGAGVTTLLPDLPALPEAVAHEPRPHDYDVEHYRVALEVEPSSGRIDGAVSVRFRPTLPGLARLALDAAGLDVQRVEEEEKGALDFETSGDRLLVDLGRPRDLGEPITVRVVYAGAPRRGIYFLGPDRDHPDRPVQVYTQGEPEDTRYWIPCWDYPNDRATSEMAVTVPASLRTVAAGALVGQEAHPERGTRTDTWRMEEDHVSYLFTLVAGEHVLVEDRWREVPLWYVVEPADEPLARPTFEKTPGIMEFFSEWIGVRYPFPKYAQVCVRDALFGGMENVTATTLTRTALHDASLAEDAPATGLVAHELAHQWFGDLVTCADWSHVWLNEGFASYFDLLYTEATEGWDEFRLEARRSQKAYADHCRGASRHPVVWNRYADPVDLLDAHVYAGGAVRLDLLRFLLGDDVFRRAVGAWVKENRNRCVTTEDFRACLEEESGRDLRAFFDDWFLGAGYPEFRVRSSFDADASALLLEIEQTQSAEAGTPFVFRTPVEVAAYTGDGERHSFRIPIASRAQTAVLPLPGPPILVRFDPASRIPKRLDFEKSQEEWIFQLARDADPIGRIEAAEALAKIGASEKAPAPRASDEDAPMAPAVAGPSRTSVSEALARAAAADTFHGVREAAVEALGEIRGDAARAAVVSALGDPEAKVRRAACAALGRFEGDAHAAEALRATLEKDASVYTAASAASALGKVKAPGAFDFLSSQVGRPSHNEVLRSAVYGALGDLGDARALPLFLQGASVRAPDASRVAAISALGKFAATSPGAVEALEDLLEDSSSRIRRAAAAALGSAADLSVEATLHARLKDEPDGRARAGLADSIRKIRREAIEKGTAGPALAAEAARRRADLARLEAEEKDAEADAAAARARIEELRARRRAAESGLERVGTGRDG